MSRSGPAGEPSHHVPPQTIDRLHRFWLTCGLAEAAWAESLRTYQRYWGLIEAHSAAAGLMGSVSARDFYLKHVADSLAVLAAYRALLGGAVRLADVGCGAGLPGIVLAVALPQLHLAAVESNRKKAAFVALAARELGLAARVEVLPRRSRELGHEEDFRHRFELVTARAVAPAEKLIRDCRLLIAPGGSAILYKTPAAVREELTTARREAGKHGLTVEASDVIALPARVGKRQFLRIIAP